MAVPSGRVLGEWSEAGAPPVVWRVTDFWRLAAAVVVVVALLLATGTASLPTKISALIAVALPPSPSEVVQRHYSLLSAGDLESAWQTLSPAFQSQTTFLSWSRANTRSAISVRETSVIGQGSTSVTVEGVIEVRDSRGNVRTSQAQWSLSLVDGRWRIDSFSMGGPPPLELSAS